MNYYIVVHNNQIVSYGSTTGSIQQIREMNEGQTLLVDEKNYSLVAACVGDLQWGITLLKDLQNKVDNCSTTK
jgi:hypothetical protein